MQVRFREIRGSEKSIAMLMQMAPRILEEASRLNGIRRLVFMKAGEDTYYLTSLTESGFDLNVGERIVERVADELRTFGLDFETEIFETIEGASFRTDGAGTAPYVAKGLQARYFNIEGQSAEDTARLAPLIDEQFGNLYDADDTELDALCEGLAGSNSSRVLAISTDSKSLDSVGSALANAAKIGKLEGIKVEIQETMDAMVEASLSVPEGWVTEKTEPKAGTEPRYRFDEATLLTEIGNASQKT